MGDDISRVGHQFLEAGDGAVDGLDPVVDVEDLTLPENLPPDRGRDRLLVVGPDVGQDRMTILRVGS